MENVVHRLIEQWTPLHQYFHVINFKNPDSFNEISNFLTELTNKLYFLFLCLY